CNFRFKFSFRFPFMGYVVKRDVESLRECAQLVVIAHYAADFGPQRVEKITDDDVAKAMVFFGNQYGQPFLLWWIYDYLGSYWYSIDEVGGKQLVIFRFTCADNSYIEALGGFIHIFAHGNDVQGMARYRIGNPANQSHGIAALDENKGLVYHDLL